MKRLILLTCLLVFSVAVNINAQEDHKGDKGILGKIEQLERAKLIDILDLKEDVAVRFFARRKEFRKKQHDYFEKRERMVDKIEKKLKEDPNLGKDESIDLLKDLLKYDEKIYENKKKFYESLSDILTQQQILKLAVFDNRFMREIRQILTGKRKDNHG